MTKYEVVEQLKREICSRQPVSSQLDRLIALCRAPLVAEVERLRNELSTTDVLLEECKMDWSGDVTQIKAEHAHGLLALQADRDDWKARAEAELARVQAVAEWQGSADGGKSWRRIDKPRGESIESRVAHLRNMTNSQGRPIYLIRALYTTPQPAAQEPDCAVPVVEQFLQDGDQHLLRSFIETTEDDEGYMLTKPEIKRLAELGVVQSHGFGKYSVTMFGHWVHERYWHQNPSLPLKTNTDRTADAAIAAGQQYLKENGKC